MQACSFDKLILMYRPLQLNKRYSFDGYRCIYYAITWLRQSIFKKRPLLPAIRLTAVQCVTAVINDCRDDCVGINLAGLEYIELTENARHFDTEPTITHRHIPFVKDWIRTHRQPVHPGCCCFSCWNCCYQRWNAANEWRAQSRRGVNRSHVKSFSTHAIVSHYLLCSYTMFMRK